MAMVVLARVMVSSAAGKSGHSLPETPVAEPNALDSPIAQQLYLSRTAVAF
ncbi:MAG: hypothetical protein ACUVX8_10535 [Candidatus Zipacnadales bacterium]